MCIDCESTLDLSLLLKTEQDFLWMNFAPGYLSAKSVSALQGIYDLVDTPSMLSKSILLAIIRLFIGVLLFFL